jgi:hypothetical protein
MTADEPCHAVAVLEQRVQLLDSEAIWQSSIVPLPGSADAESVSCNDKHHAKRTQPAGAFQFISLQPLRVMVHRSLAAGSGPA